MSALRRGDEGKLRSARAGRVQGAGYGVVLSTDESKLFGGRIGKPKVAVCPQCGEISLYIEDVEKLR